MELLFSEHTTLDFLGCVSSSGWGSAGGEDSESGVAFLNSGPSFLTWRTQTLVLSPHFPPCRLCRVLLP